MIGEGELPRLGPVFVTHDEVPKPDALRIRTVIDGFVRQDWGTGDMIRDVPALSAFPSSRRILLPGTPHGVGFARNPPVRRQPGGTVTSDFGRIGTPMNRVVAEATRAESAYPRTRTYPPRRLGPRRSFRNTWRIEP